MLYPRIRAKGNIWNNWKSKIESIYRKTIAQRVHGKMHPHIAMRVKKINIEIEI
jgi:hypothetical protein